MVTRSGVFNRFLFFGNGRSLVVCCCWLFERFLFLILSVVSLDDILFLFLKDKKGTFRGGVVLKKVLFAD